LQNPYILEGNQIPDAEEAGVAKLTQLFLTQLLAGVGLSMPSFP
jgi:hypothetical protein